VGRRFLEVAQWLLLQNMRGDLADGGGYEMVMPIDMPIRIARAMLCSLTISSRWYGVALSSPRTTG
jgi:hypothetical protein